MLNKEFANSIIKKEVLKTVLKKDFKPEKLFGAATPFLDFKLWYGKDDNLGMYVYLKREAEFIFFLLSFKECKPLLREIDIIENDISKEFNSRMIHELQIPRTENQIEENKVIIDLNRGKYNIEEEFFTNIPGLDSLNNFFNFSSFEVFRKIHSFNYETRLYNFSLYYKKEFSFQNVIERASWNWRITDIGFLKIFSFYIVSILSDEKKELKSMNDLVSSHFHKIRKMETSIYSGASDKKQFILGMNHIIGISIAKLTPNILSFDNFDFEDYYLRIMDIYEEDLKD